MAETTTARKYLKGGEFIVHATEAADIFIPEDFDEEALMIRQMCDDFIHEAGSRLHELEEQVALLEEAGELGLLGAHIPELYGGMGLSTNVNTLISEALGKAGGSYDTSFAAHIGIGMLPILYFGTREQKEKYLPKLASGAWKAAYCLTEPASGSDALAARTRADLTDDGKNYVLNGQKMWISNAGFADVFIVFAKIGGEEFTGFIVEAGLPGIRLGQEEHKLGIKGSSTRQVFFEDVKIPADALLGKAGKGHRIAFNALNIGRFKLGTMAMGGCKYASTLSVRYANERQQFGQAISGFGAIQYKLAQQVMQAFAVESAIYRVSDMLQQLHGAMMAEGKTFEEAHLLSAREYSSECAIIKVSGSEYLHYAVDEMVQIFGGNGFSEEYPAALAYRDSRINRIYEGTNEINRLLMVSQIVKRAFKGEIDLVGPAWEVQKELTQMPSLATPEGSLGQEEKAVVDFKKILLLVAGAAVKYQMDGKHDLRHEQQIVMQIADIAMDVFIAESLLLRVQKLQRGDYQKDPELIGAILRLFLYEAQHRIAKHASDALLSFAIGDELTIMLKGIRRFTKYPPVNVKKERKAIAAAAIAENGYPL